MRPVRWNTENIEGEIAESYSSVAELINDAEAESSRADALSTAHLTAFESIKPRTSQWNTLKERASSLLEQVRLIRRNSERERRGLSAELARARWMKPVRDFRQAARHGEKHPGLFSALGQLWWRLAGWLGFNQTKAKTSSQRSSRR